jgi:hypothetical protein
MSENLDPSDTGGILKASGPGVEQIAPGMSVVSIDGGHIGKVKEVANSEFLVDRPMLRDLWIPFTAVVEAAEHGGAFRRGPTQDTQVVLFVSANDVDDQGWRHP